MDITFLLGTKIIELILIVLIGYGLVKSKLLKSEDSKPLSIIGLYVISPSVMIEAFQIDYTSEILQGLQLSLLMAVFLHIILIIIGALLKRLLNLDPIEHATSIYSNSGNLIIPIVMSLFGKEWVIYASCFIVVQTFLFWTHCRLIIVGKGNLSLKTIAKNINIWSILVGAFLFAFQIKLPNIINGTLSSIRRHLKESQKFWIENGEVIVLISFLATTSPSASTVTQMAVIYNNNPQKASAIYGITTLLCMFTMPLVIALYQMWG